MSPLVLVLVLQAAPLSPEASAGEAYGGLVARAVEAAQAGRLDAALQFLEEAIASDRARPEALIERGGVFFLQEKYDAAARDLEQALAHGEDAHARELLAASLHLLGREEEALASWNRLGGPKVAGLEITGLEHTRDEVARRELLFAEGERLELGELRESERRLLETGAFEQVTVRTRPHGDGTASVEVALLERHGFASGPAELAVGALAQLADRRASLRYANLGGRGGSVFGSWRFAPNRPELALGLEWPRPFGLGANLRLLARRGRQGYLFEEPVERTSRGIDLGLRRVLGARTVAEAALSFRDRAFSAPDPEAQPGRIAGPHVGLEQRLLERRGHLLDGALRVFASTPALGADFRFVRAVGSLRYERALGQAGEPGGEGSTLVARALYGWGSDSLPLDEGFLPGGGPESPFPLRAHRQFEDGVASGVPLGRSLLLFNTEWRHGLARVGPVRLGAALFYDAGQSSRGSNPSRWLHDWGIGLRLKFKATVVRIDFGHGLVDGSNALTVGLGHAF